MVKLCLLVGIAVLVVTYIGYIVLALCTAGCAWLGWRWWSAHRLSQRLGQRHTEPRGTVVDPDDGPRLILPEPIPLTRGDVALFRSRMGRPRPAA